MSDGLTSKDIQEIVMTQIQPKSYVDSVVYKIIEDRIKDAEKKFLAEIDKDIEDSFANYIKLEMTNNG